MPSVSKKPEAGTIFFIFIYFHHISLGYAFIILHILHVFSRFLM